VVDHTVVCESMSRSLSRCACRPFQAILRFACSRSDQAPTLQPPVQCTPTLRARHLLSWQWSPLLTDHAAGRVTAWIEHFCRICADFAPWNGIPEDPVNGSSHTVLGPWWAFRHCSGAAEGSGSLDEAEARLSSVGGTSHSGEREVVLGRLIADQWSPATGRLEVTTVGVDGVPSWVMLAGRCAVVAQSTVVPRG
jgi:hypothetical protein